MLGFLVSLCFTELRTSSSPDARHNVRASTVPRLAVPPYTVYGSNRTRPQGSKKSTLKMGSLSWSLDAKMSAKYYGEVHFACSVISLLPRMELFVVLGNVCLELCSNGAIFAAEKVSCK